MKIFVYGTLKRGGQNHHHLAGQIFLGEARTARGYTLYELTGYPGMIAQTGGADGVSGELWDIDAACLARLDEVEGLAEGLYHRADVPLLPPFAGQSAETYLYSRSVAGRRKLGEIWPV